MASPEPARRCAVYRAPRPCTPVGALLPLVGLLFFSISISAHESRGVVQPHQGIRLGLLEVDFRYFAICYGGRLGMRRRGQ